MLIIVDALDEYDGKTLNAENMVPVLLFVRKLICTCQ
jgi:hypothetical protein